MNLTLAARGTDEELLLALATWDRCPPAVLDVVRERAQNVDEPEGATAVDLQLVVRPDGDRSPAALYWMGPTRLGAVLALTDDPVVVQELLEGVDEYTLATYVHDTARAHPAAVQRLTTLAVAGDAVAAWALLGHVDGPVQAQLLTVAATQLPVMAAGGDTRSVLTWIGEALRHADHLDQWVTAVPGPVAAVLSWFATVHAGGSDPRRVFLDELVASAAGQGPRPWWWTDDLGFLAGQDDHSRVPWSELVTISGDEDVAQAALDLGHRLGAVSFAISGHPRLVGTPVDVVAQCRCAGLRLLVSADPDDARRRLVRTRLASTTPATLVQWALAHPGDAQRLDQAVAHVKAVVARSRPQLWPLWALAAAELACAGATCRWHWAGAADLASQLAGTDAGDAGGAPRMVDALVDLAGARAGGAGIGSCPVAVLTGGAGARRPWLTAELASWWAKLARSSDPTFVRVVLDLAGDFPGTFDDLAATAAAVTA